MKASDILRGYRLPAVLAALQLGAATILALVSPAHLPADDAMTYFTQAVTLWLGGFPANPARPLFYPFLLSLGMRWLGVSALSLRIGQGLVLAAAALLVYRLALVLGGRKAAAAATILFVLHPDLIFYSSQFYRESVTAFLLILALNLWQIMLRRPRPFNAILAGTATGMLVLVKPEFASLALVMAAIGAGRAVATRDFKTHAAPWVVCGVMSLLVVSPAILTARAVYGEWIFINTYKGYNYAWSWCGRVPAQDRGLPFVEREDERLRDIVPELNRRFFLADPSVPFGRRDDELLRMAISCIRRDPGQAAKTYVLRMVHALFWLKSQSSAWVRNGDFGRAWSPALVQGILILALGVPLVSLMLAGAGVPGLLRTREGQPVAVSLFWFVLFYSTVTFFARFRIALWPAFAVAAGYGSQAVLEAIRDRRRARLVGFGGWALVSLVSVGLLARGSAGCPCEAGESFPALADRANWTEFRPGPGLAQGEQRRLLLVLAEVFYQNGTAELAHRDLGLFIRRHKPALDAHALVDAAGFYFDKRLFDVAAIFYGNKEACFGPDPVTTGRLTLIRDMARTVTLSRWRPLGPAGRGCRVWGAELAEPAATDPALPPLSMTLRYGQRTLEYRAPTAEPRMPFTYAVNAARVEVVLPRQIAPPAPDRPAELTYFATAPPAASD